MFFVSLCKYPANLSTFASSKAASISSRRQNGEGLRFWIANNSAIAVSDFSPPDICIILISFFPGGCALMIIPVSSKSSSSTRASEPCPPPNSSLNALSNSLWISLNPSANCFLIPSSSSSMIRTREASASTKSSCCPLRKLYLSDSSLNSSIALTLTLPIERIAFLILAASFFI